MLTYLFPGQGSQIKGMGAGLFEQFADLVSAADKILGYSIKNLCLNDPEQQLQFTQFTQPALYTVSALSYFKKLAENSKKPDYVAGHSLGEYNALLAANVFDFETGLQLVKKRGELMAQATAGGMAAILGLTLNKVQDILQNNQLSSLAIANYNSYTQIVISGPKSDIDKSQHYFAALDGVNFIPLKVSGAFHSSYMQQAQTEFADYLNTFEFQIPTISVIANVDVSTYHPAVIKKNLVGQITNTVKWTQTIDYLNSFPNMVFEEIGPGNVLTNLVKRIQKRQ